MPLRVSQCPQATWLEYKLTIPNPEFKKKKVILVAVPGAFTPTCQVSHVPSYLDNADKLKSKGVDQVVFIASNDPFVMSAWGKANGVKDDFVVCCLIFCILFSNNNYG